MKDEKHMTLQENFSTLADDAIIKKLYLGSLGNMVLTAVAILVAGLVDGVAIGRFLGTDAMAAYGLVNPIYLFISAVGAVTSTGASAYCGRFLGKGNIEEAKIGYSTNFVFTAIFSLAGTLVCFVFGHQIVDLLGASNDLGVYECALEYIYGLAPSFLFMSFLTMFMSTFYLDGGKKYGLYGMVVSTAVNIVGDLANGFLIHGGMLGMALATSAGYIMGVAVMLLHFKEEHIFSVTLRNFTLKPMIEITQLGLPKAVNKFCNFFRNLILNRIIVFVANTTALAAFTIRNTLNNLFAAGTTGIGHATMLMSSVYVGEEDKTSLKKVLAVSIKYGLLISMGICIVMLAISKYLVSFMSKESEVIMVGTESLRWYLISIPMYTLVMVFMNYYQAMGKKMLTAVVCFLDNFGFVVLFAVILSPFMGVRGVWIAFPVGEVAMLAVIYCLSWKHCGHMPHSIEDFMLLPDSFDTTDKERYFGTATSCEEACIQSEMVRQFLIGQDVTPTDAHILALLVEEICVNAIRFGKSDNKKKDPIAEIYLVHANNEWRLRIRDNGTTFNPQKWYQTNENNKEVSGMGIRMAFKLIDALEYTVLYSNTLEINNLLLRIPDNAEPAQVIRINQGGASECLTL